VQLVQIRQIPRTVRRTVHCSVHVAYDVPRLFSVWRERREEEKRDRERERQRENEGSATRMSVGTRVGRHLPIRIHAQGTHTCTHAQGRLIRSRGATPDERGRDNGRASGRERERALIERN